jgi:hypothetical protein
VQLSARLRSQDGFIREVVWIVVILAIIAVVILDGMAIFNAYQSAGDTAADAAKVALTDFAESQDASSAKLIAQQRVAKNGLEMTKFTMDRNPDGNVRITVTAKDHADTYAFHYLAVIPPFKKWVERTTNPVRSGAAD